MDVTLLFMITSLISLGIKVFSKLSSNIVAGGTKTKYMMYFTVNGVVACIFFLISGGFKLSFNGATLLYSVAYAAIVTLSLISNAIIYKLASISDVNIIVSSSGLIGSAVIGMLAFGERLPWDRILKICIMLAAAVLIFVEKKKKQSGEEEKRENKPFLRIAVIATFVFVALSNTFIIKSFSMSERVTDSNSFFFLTNLILVIGSALILAYQAFKSPKEFRDSVALLEPRTLCSLAGKTVLSNVEALISVLILAEIPLSLYSPISSALGVLISLVASLIFREKLSIYSYAAVALAVVSVII
ncbi:MAG: hypothetical protein IJD79_08590 [Clostridia bacterium]|nr:hypothetical protein [Clostridia bacterium]